MTLKRRNNNIGDETPYREGEKGQSIQVVCQGSQVPLDLKNIVTIRETEFLFAVFSSECGSSELLQKVNYDTSGVVENHDQEDAIVSRIQCAI